jgi:TatD DNase family protein
MFINIKTHHNAFADEVIIKNLYKDFETVETEKHLNFAMGLHPWFIEEATWKNEFNILKKISQLPNVKAIGECGLDKVCKTNFEFQQVVFIEQIKLANEISKPLLIHCARAFTEVITLLKKNKNAVPVVFHGFVRSLSQARQLVDQGYYVSFGKDLQQERIQKVVAAMPLDKIFFESDDLQMPIQSVYEIAASALQIDMELLCLQVEKNATKVFKL